MKKLSIFFTFLTISLYSQVVYDTVAHYPIGVGATYTRVVVSNVPWSVDFVTVDITNPLYSLQTVKAKDRVVGLEKPTSMALRKAAPGKTVVAAINADFFGGTGIPVGMQASNGEVVYTVGFNNKSAFMIDDAGKPHLRVAMFTGSKVIYKNTSATLTSTNRDRGTNELVMYNSYKGSSTGTNAFGTELICTPIDPWLVNDTTRLVVSSKKSSVGNATYTSSQVVLSGHGTSATFLETVSAGDTISVLPVFSNTPNRLSQFVGGIPRIVLNGRNVVDSTYTAESAPSHTYTREPRTSIGFSADSTQLYLIIADGRNPHSAGMTLKELADFMIAIGIHQGLNFDGGGSSVLVVRDQIMNKPSDGGGERSVANGLLLFSSAPTGTLNKIIMSPSKTRLYKNQTAQFSVLGFDEYFTPIKLDPASVSFSVDAGLGTVSSTGLFTAGTNPDTGYVYSFYNNIKDSAQVIIKGLTKAVINNDYVVIDTIKGAKLNLEVFDMDGVEQGYTFDEVTFTSLNPNVATVDSAGNVKGKSLGITKVIARFNSSAIDTANIDVQIGNGIQVINDLETTDGWIVSGENIDLANTKIVVSKDTLSQGAGSIRIDYQFTGNPNVNNFVYLKKKIPVYGVPDSLWIDAKSNGLNHFVSYLISDDNGELFALNSRKYASTTVFDSVPAVFSQSAPITVGAIFNYPLILEEIRVRIASARVTGTIYNGSIFIDNLRVRYPQNALSNDDSDGIPVSFTLLQNYPNPFNPNTSISFSLPESGFATLSIYDVLGNLIDVATEGYKTAGVHTVNFDAGNLSSGVYFYTLNFNGLASTKKMLLMK